MSKNYDVEFYNNHWKKITSIYFKDNLSKIEYRWMTLSYLIDKHLLSKTLDPKLIDVGSGDGTTLQLLLKSFGITGDGIEFAPIPANIATSKGFVIYQYSLEENFLLKKNYYDAVICSEVIEHLRYPQKALENINNLLKPDGMVFFSVPNIGFIKNRIQLCIGRNPLSEKNYEVSFHLHHWTFHSWKKFLEDNNFKIIELQGNKTKSLKGRVLISLRPSLFSTNLFCVAKKI